MPFKQIDSVLRMAERINAIVFLDIQVGLSTVQQEIPLLEPLSQDATGTPWHRPGILDENRQETWYSNRHHGCE